MEEPELIEFYGAECDHCRMVATFLDRIEEEDGIRVDWDDSWAHLRGSNTEPIIRVITESTSESKASELNVSLMEELKNTVY